MSEVKNLMFLFDRMPDQDGCIFIEVENAEGQSVCAGEWRTRDDGLVELVVPVNYDDAQRLRADTAEAELEVLKREVECRISNEVNAVEALAAAEQRIAELKSVLERMLEDDDMPVHWFAQRIDAALNPNPEAESHE